jgi:uncharacterized protein YjdB
MIMVLLSFLLVQPVVAAYGGPGEDESGHYGQGGSGKGGSGGIGEHSSTDPNAEPSDGEHQGGGGSGSGQGGSGNGQGSGGGGKDNAPPEEGGTITLIVNVTGIEVGKEVNVTLIREDISTVVKTQNHIAVFHSEPSGDCVLSGEAVPGYTIPSEEISLIGVEKDVEATLEYELISEGIAVNGVSLSHERIYLFSTETADIRAEIVPANANNQNVTWLSDNTDVAAVSGSSLSLEAEITAVAPGTTQIIVKTAEGNFTDVCTVIVPKIISIHELAPVTAVKGEIISLPKEVTVDVEYPDRESATNVPVEWVGYADYKFAVPYENPDISYTLTGKIVGTAQTTKFIINVDTSASPANPVTGVTLDVSTLSLYIGEDYAFTASIKTSDLNPPTNPSLIWTSNNNSVATVENGVVTGVSPGTAIITVTTVDGGFIARCIVSIAPTVEIAYIFASYENGEAPEEGFASKEEVCINASYLVETLNITEPTKYYVKVEEKSSDPALGDGTVEISIGAPIFNLFDVTEFELTDSYSAMYFVLMSTDPSFPLDDEKTLRANFKVGTATPSVPDEGVIVTAEVDESGYLDSPEGLIFVLGRELPDKTADQTMWHDYLWMDKILEAMGEDSDSLDNEMAIKAEVIADPYADKFKDKLFFVDEAKRIGVLTDGQVKWAPGKETLKLGGYLLLEVTPPGYVDNLNLVSPDSEDGALLKELRLARDGTIERHVTNIYVGYDPGLGSPGIPDPITTDPSTPNPDNSPDITNDDDNQDNNKGNYSNVSSNTTTEITSSLIATDSLVLTLDSFNELISSKNFKGHWSKDHMTNLVKKGIFKKDYSEDILNVDSFISEGEVLELVKAASKNENFDPSKVQFKDILGMTRQKALVMIMLAFDIDKSDVIELPFKDADLIDENAKGYVSAAYNQCIVKGCPDNTFKPNNPVTRAEFYTMLSRILGN